MAKPCGPTAFMVTGELILPSTTCNSKSIMREVMDTLNTVGECESFRFNDGTLKMKSDDIGTVVCVLTCVTKQNILRLKVKFGVWP